jgi:hypothetical protein
MGSAIRRAFSPLPHLPAVLGLSLAGVVVLVSSLMVVTGAWGSGIPDGSTSPVGDTDVGALDTDPAPTAVEPPSGDTDAAGDPASDGVDTEEVRDPETGPIADADTDPDRDASPAGTAERGTLRLQHVGDVQLDPDAHPSLRRLGGGIWDDVRDVFARADVVLANLECAATDRDDPQGKQFVFRCDLDELPVMRDAGVTGVTVANNHSGDHGVPGIVDSLRNAEAAGLVAIGAGADEVEAYAPRIVEVQGWRVALLGFGGVVPHPDWTSRGDQPGQASGYDTAAMVRAVEAAGADADLVVASIHWGEEGSFEPREEDREKADALVAAGADAVIGHHAHRLQPLERIDGVPVFWNLGNFVWPRLSDDGARTAVAELVFSPDGTVDACLLPVEIDRDGRPVPTGGDPTCR